MTSSQAAQQLSVVSCQQQQQQLHGLVDCPPSHPCHAHAGAGDRHVINSHVNDDGGEIDSRAAL